MALKPNEEEEDSEKKKEESELSSEAMIVEGDQGPIFNPEMKTYWMPDRMCKLCHNCDLAFTMFKRRHHCRFCGHVFCHNCSAYFIEGRFIGTQGFLRACKLCHDQVLVSPTMSSQKKRINQRNQSQRKPPTTRQPSKAPPIKGARTSRNLSITTLDDVKKSKEKGADIPRQMRRVSSAGEVKKDDSIFEDKPLRIEAERKSTRSPTTDDSIGGEAAPEARMSEVSEVYHAEMEELSQPPEHKAAFQVMAVPIAELNDLMLSSDQQEQSTEHRRILEGVAMNHLERMVHYMLGLSEVLKSGADWAPTVVSLCQQVCANVDPDVKNGDELDIRPYVKIKTIPGGDMSECCYVDGVVFRKTPIKKVMANRHLQQPRVLLLSCSIEFERQGSRISYFDALVEQESHYMKILVDKILMLKPHLILVGKSVSRYAQQLLSDAGVVVVQHVKANLMKRIARCVGAQILPSTDHVVNHGQKALGYANEFFIRSFYSPDLEQRIKYMRDGLSGTPRERERALKMSEAEMIKRVYGRVRGNGKVAYAYLVGCPRQLGCTVVLRGTSKLQLQEVKRITRFAVSVAYNLRLEVSFLHDRGATFPLSHVAQLALSSSISAHKSQKLLSTSMEVNHGPPPNRRGRPWGGDHDHQHTTVYDHQALLITHTWMCKQMQCMPAEVKGIRFYKESLDTGLGQFLLDSCFNFNYKCPHVNCKRSVTEHVLSFIHKDGRVSISVFDVDEYKNQDPWERDREREQEERSRHEGRSRRKNYSRPLRMWNYCNKCDRVVGDPVMMSGDTWKFSFGKFLEVYFYNKTAIGRHQGCGHSIQTDLTLFFGCDKLVAQFKYEHIDPYTIYVRNYLTFNKDWHISEVQKVIIETLHITCPIFEAFLARIREFHQAVSESQLKSYEKKSLHRELMDMQREVATGSILFFNQLPSLLKDKDYWDEMKMMKARMFTILDEADWVSKQEEWEYNKSWALREMRFGPTLKSADWLMLRFPVLLRRKLFLVMQNWNDRLATAGRILQVLEKNKGNQNDRIKEDMEELVLLKAGGKERVQKAQRRRDEKQDKDKDNGSDSEKEAEDDFYLRYEKEKRLGDDRALRDQISARDQFLGQILKNIIDLAVAESEGNPELPVKCTLETLLWDVEDRLKEEHMKEKRMRASAALGIPQVGIRVEPEKPTVKTGFDILTPRKANKEGQLSSIRKYEKLRIGTQEEYYPMPDSPAFGQRQLSAGHQKMRAASFVTSQSMDFTTNGLDEISKAALQAESQSLLKENEVRDIEGIPKDLQEKYQVYPKVRKIGRSPKLNETNPIVHDSDSEELDLVDEVVMPMEDSAPPTPPSPSEPVNEASADAELSVELAYNVAQKEDNKDHNQKGKKSAAAKFQNALARFMGKDIVEEIDWAVSLGQLSEGKPHLEPGMDGKAVLVFEDQPMSIIAYSLISKEYAKAMDEFRRRSMLADQSMYMYDEERRKAVNDVMKQVGTSAEPLPDMDPPIKTPKLTGSISQSYTKSELEKLILSQQKTDFKHRFSDVDEKGNTTVKFVCHSYWALQFHALRAAYCDAGQFSDEGFVHSLSAAHSWDARGGKSGAQFFMTQDSRFVVKFVSRTELQMFLEVAPAYFEYMAKALFHGIASVLVKIMGVYQIGYHNRTNGKRYMEQAVVMQNLFHERKITKIFDLKGSTRSRYVNVNDFDEESGKGRLMNENKPTQVLLDENLMEWTDGRPLPLCGWSQNAFQKAIMNDSMFLSLINVVDYSILVGIDEESHELVVGIIDYMRQYDIIKKMERVGKSVGMIAGQAEPTIIQPPSYKARFILAMERYFMSVPDKWTSM